MKNFIFLLSLFYSFSILSQTVLTPDWVKKKTSPVGGNCEGWGVDIDNSGNIYWPISVDSQSQGLDIICYKFNPSGSSLWTTPFFMGGVGTQHSYVVNARDSALYIGGRECPGLVNSCNMLLSKVDKSTGALIWSRTKNFASNGYDEVDGLVIKNDGIYCGGWAQSLQSGSYQSEIGLWKLAFNGNTIWTNSFGKLNSAEHQDGHFVVDNNHIYAAGLWGGSGIANLYNGHSFLGKFSKTTGNFVDSTLFGHQSNNFLDIENALGMTSDGTYLYVTGYTTPPSGKGWQIFIAKFDKNLTQLWFKEWGSSGTESARGIAVHNGIIYIAGLTESSPYVVGGGKSDALLLRYDTAGTFISYNTWGDYNNNAFRDIVVNSQGIYLTGSSQDTAVAGADKEAFLIKVANYSHLISQQGSSKMEPTIFPNPSNGTVNFLFPTTKYKAGSILIRDMQGKIVQNYQLEPNLEQLSLTLNLEGVFIVTIRLDEHKFTKKIINY